MFDRDRERGREMRDYRDYRSERDARLSQSDWRDRERMRERGRERERERERERDRERERQREFERERDQRSRGVVLPPLLPPFGADGAFVARHAARRACICVLVPV